MPECVHNTRSRNGNLLAGKATLTREIVIVPVGLKVVEGRFQDAAVIRFMMNGFAALFAVIDRFDRA